VTSPNGTLIVRPNVSLTDDAGNKWFFKNGQVYKNGNVDALTNRVIAIGFINGKVVQENTDKLWWAKTYQGYDGWGTPGNGDGHIANPFPASRYGTTIVPQSTMALVDRSGNLWWIEAGKVIENGVVDRLTNGVIEMAIDIDGKIYQENNNKLWWQKTYQGYDGWGTPGTSDGHVPAPQPTATVANIFGSAVFNTTPGTWGPNDFIVNLSPSSTWTGSINFTNRYSPSTLTINAEAHSVFNNVASTIEFSNVDIPVPVVGIGKFAVGLGKLEFEGPVAAGQSVTVNVSIAYSSTNATLQIDKPAEFLGSTTIVYQGNSNNPLSVAPVGEIDLMGLATADSYSYRNDMLSIFSGKSVIDTLRFHDGTIHGFAVEKTATSVNIVNIIDPSHPPVGLPVHATT